MMGVLFPPPPGPAQIERERRMQRWGLLAIFVLSAGGWAMLAWTITLMARCMA
jgi:hypothetical protein